MDHTLFQQLVMVTEDWEETAEAWWVEDLTHQDRWWAEDIAREEAQDQTDWKFWAKLLALEHEQIQVLWKQNTILGYAVQATDDNHQVLDTILGLVVSFHAHCFPIPCPIGSPGSHTLSCSRPHLGLGGGPKVSPDGRNP
ncbi:hypothetical protein Y1Q_0016147 [Alligator mississippiensis]|uniref:Uncharacterized protein n=1 Tax=Alligator mississippiensis TaxID=8496 RepID=A0A151P1C9_ALLMI|nr:hypothetical protein Y1Q_0016147 [Alligator mississippiensis]